MAGDDRPYQGGIQRICHITGKVASLTGANTKSFSGKHKGGKLIKELSTLVFSPNWQYVILSKQCKQDTCCNG